VATGEPYAAVRPAEERDTDAAAALIGAESPWLFSGAGLRHRQRSLPARARRATWVAEIGATIVGWGEAEFDWASDAKDVGSVWALVAPEHRRRGVGSALFEQAVAHVIAHGARELRSWTLAGSDSFLERRGFARAREERVSAVDPREVDTSRLDELPPAVEIVPLTALLDRLDEVHAVYAEAAADMPADHPENSIAYEEWLTETIANPDLSRDGSMIVLSDGVPAALSWLLVVAEQRVAMHELTGTARAHRRRGLARLAKLAALRWCAANGITSVRTGNDSTNVGMLAINRDVGFRPLAVETEWVQRL